MVNQVFIGAGVTLLGIVVTQIFAIRLANVQANRQERLEAQKWEQQKAAHETEVAEQQRERDAAASDQRAQFLRDRHQEFLSLVFTAHERLMDRTIAAVNQQATEAPAAKTAAGAARQAYALALLYLGDDLRLLARALYAAAVDADLVLEQKKADLFDEKVKAWRAAFDQIDSYFWHEWDWSKPEDAGAPKPSGPAANTEASAAVSLAR